MEIELMARHIFKTLIECLEASEDNTVERVCEAASRAQAMMHAMKGAPAAETVTPIIVEQKPKRKRRTKEEMAVETYDASNREHKKIFADAFVWCGYSLDTQAELAKELSKKAEKEKRLPTTSDLATFISGAQSK